MLIVPLSKLIQAFRIIIFMYGCVWQTASRPTWLEQYSYRVFWSVMASTWAMSSWISCGNKSTRPTILIRIPNRSNSSLIRCSTTVILDDQDTCTKKKEKRKKKRETMIEICLRHEWKTHPLSQACLIRSFPISISFSTSVVERL